MSKREYYDSQHAEQRLSSTVVAIEDELFYINGVIGMGRGGVFNLSATKLGDKQDIIINTNSDIRTDNLGRIHTFNWMNGPNGATEAHYLSRYPQRQYKEGLSGNNSKITGIRPGGNRARFSYIKGCIGLQEAFQNKFPNIEKARNMSREWDGDDPYIAISRSFCVNHSGSLAFKRQTSIGKVQGKDNLVLKNNFMFLKEFLEEEMNSVQPY